MAVGVLCVSPPVYLTLRQSLPVCGFYYESPPPPPDLSTKFDGLESWLFSMTVRLWKSRVCVCVCVCDKQAIYSFLVMKIRLLLKQQDGRALAKK